MLGRMAEQAKTKAGDNSADDKARKKPLQVQPPALGFEAQPLWVSPEAMAGTPMAMAPVTTPPPPPVTVPAHSTNRSQRQANVVGLQHALGNAHVRRAIATHGRSLATAGAKGGMAGEAAVEERKDDTETPYGAPFAIAAAAPPDEPKSGPPGIARRKAETRVVEPVRRKEDDRPPEAEDDEAPAITEAPAEEGSIERSVDSGLVQRDNGAGGGGGAPTPPIDTNTANKARAQKILQDCFGHIKPIVAPKIGFLDQGALRTKHDEMQIRLNRTNSRAEGGPRPWQLGDNAQVFQTFEGFADQEQQTIYVLDMNSGGGGSADSAVVLMAHEMLHTNAAGGWAGTVGGAIDEGTTETLTQKAAAKAGVSGTSAYAGQVALVGRIAAMVGANMLEAAYFGGAASLILAFDATGGPGTWTKFHDAIGKHDQETVDAILDKDYAKMKIGQIKDLLGGWVSDDDLNAIAGIWATIQPGDKARVKAAIEPLVGDLWDIGQRTRLRVILVS
jgi:hypothetical protein